LFRGFTAVSGNEAMAVWREYEKQQKMKKDSGEYDN